MDFDLRVTALARPWSNCTVNYRPVLSSKRVLQNNKAATVHRKFQGGRKIGHGSHMGARHQDRLKSKSCRGVKFTMELVTRYYFLSESCCVVSVGPPLWREVGSVSCQSLSSMFSPLSKIQYNLHCTCHMFYVYAIYTRLLSAQAQYSRSCQNLRYNSSLDTWTAVRLTAAKFKPLMFSVLGFSLWTFTFSWFCITSACCLHNFVI
jgi:hypothetical protein